MRFGAGLAILALGVVGLGWWAKVEYATHVQGLLERAAQDVAATSVHGVTPEVQGRDIRISGYADGAAEHDTLIAAFDAIEGRRVIIEALDVLPVVTPFTLGAIWLDGALVVQGYVPTVPARDALAAMGADGLTLAAGAPDRQWAEAAITGIEALRLLEDGTLALNARRMSVSGRARTPAEGEAVRAALDALPEGYQADLGMSYVDDGTPPAYSLHYSATSGAWLEGKLPPGVGAMALAEALGLSQIDNDAEQGLLGEAGTVPDALAMLAPWMPEFEALDVSVSTDGTDVSAGVGAGADLELLRAALGADLPGITVVVNAVAPDGEEGARRVNPLTGAEEELRGQFWLPLPGFAPNAETCAAQAEAVLTRRQIGFVTGSARLNARARGAVNALASVLGLCLRDAGLQAEIGGHTDSTGSAESNLALSLERAAAVRDALIMRGVPEAQLSAEGYGAAQPIADNETEEGRSANRRTAVRWID